MPGCKPYLLLFGLTCFVMSPLSWSANAVEKMLWDNGLASYEATKASLRNNTDLSDISAILSSRCDANWSNAGEINALEQQSAAYNSDVGLEFRAGYTSRDIQRNPDEVDGNTYMELSWELLTNGYLDNQYQATDYKRQAAIKAVFGKLKQHEINYQCRRFNLNRHFAGLELQLNSIKLKFMEAVYGVEKQAYFSGASYLDELMIPEEDIMLARQTLARLHADPTLATSKLALINPPVIDVDLAAILQEIAQNKDFAESHRLTRLRIEDQAKQEDSFLQGSRFRLFLRKEFDVFNSGQEDLVAGARLQMPITFGEPGSQSEAKLNQLEQDFSHEQWEIMTRTRAAYVALQEQLERTTRQQYRVLRAQEAMRRIQSYTALEMPLDIAAVNVRVKTYIDAAIELGHAKEELYRRVNEIFLVSRVEYNEKFIKVNPLNETEHRARPGERSVYIWSEQFNRYSNAELFALFEAKALKHALVSVGSKVNAKKLIEFMQEAAQHHVRVSQLFGEAKWALQENHNQALAAVEARLQYGDAIHLDIEPHALAQYKANPKQVLQDLTKLVAAIRERHPDINLTLSVPHHWPAEVLRALGNDVDRVYLMAYETRDAEVISRRIKTVLASVPLNKLVVALRKQDFNTELQLEAAIELLSQATGVTQFAVHKLDIYTQE